MVEERRDRGFLIYTNDAIAPPFLPTEGVAQGSEGDSPYKRELAKGGETIRIPIQHGLGDMPLPAWIEK